MNRTSTLPPRFDPLAPAVLEDPYPEYARLRAAGGLSRGGAGTWVASRHADVAALLRDGRVCSQFPPDYRRLAAGDGATSAFMGRIVLYRDPPDHTRLRTLIGQAFRAQLVRRLEGRIGELVDELLEPALERGRLDVVADLAFPLPVTVTCELMGIPAPDRALIRPRALALGRAFATVVPETARRDADEAVLWLRDYLGALLEERRHNPAADLLSQLLAAGVDDDSLTSDEIVDNAVFAFFAGFETTTNVIANGCAALLRHPDQLARLDADRTLVRSAVEEFLRYDAPVQGVARLVRRRLELGGRTLRPGRVLVLLLGSANRDERAFARPDAFDVGRTPNRHVSFGGGVHHCMGATLARIETRVALARLLARCAKLELRGEPVRERSTGFRAYASLPVEVRPR